jgi:hypothetical protein
MIPTVLHHMIVSSGRPYADLCLSMEAEQFIERQIRRKIQYRWIWRQNSGEELPLPSGPIPALKTHGSLSEAS